MGQLSLQVVAKRGTDAMVRSGLFARVTINIVDDNGNLVIAIHEGLLKRSPEGEMYVQSPRIGDKKSASGTALKYWFFAKDQTDWVKYIVDEAVRQIGGVPTDVPAGPVNRGGPAPVGPGHNGPASAGGPPARAPVPGPAARTAPPAAARPTGPGILGDPWAPGGKR